jgi:PadR family transcriptional regulator, regulatory protein PadR
LKNEYHDQLLSSWEDVYKKGQLTLWIMLSLADGPKHMQLIKAFIGDATNHALTVDDKSMYRALRRYVEAEMLSYTVEPSDTGPDRKIYQLTGIGRSVFESFIDRNVKIFYVPEIKQLITGK